MTAVLGLALYDRTAEDTARTIVTRYSTSFSFATRLLGPRVRRHVRNIYALVRIADEIVDGPAAEAGLSPTDTADALDALERETLTAIARGFSTNLVVHAFARTARLCSFDDGLIHAFFASMRTDVDTTRHDDRSRERYVYGSAEAVGLLCLRVFVRADRPHGTESTALTDGARRLGAAFQNVNFLRDVDDDRDRLGRDYLGAAGSPARRTAVLDEIDADLAAGARAIRLLPRDCRRAVTAAHDLFAALSERLRDTDGPGRVRVPDRTKLRILLRAAAGRPPRPTRGTGRR